MLVNKESLFQIWDLFYYKNLTPIYTFIVVQIRQVKTKFSCM